MDQVFAARNKKLVKISKVDKTLRAYAHKGNALTGRVAVMDGKTFRECTSKVHGAYWTCKFVKGLDKPVRVMYTPRPQAAPATAGLDLSQVQAILSIIKMLKA
jgi:hypothetical protein